MTVEEDMIFNHIKGALYGVAIGDALGAPREFLSREEAMDEYGPANKLQGGGVLRCTAGKCTDDTMMTIEEAYAIAEDPDDPVPLAGDRFINWMIDDGFGIGITICNVLTAAEKIRIKQGRMLTTDQWMNLSKTYAETHRACGNGALMRSIYPGLFYKMRNQASNTAIQLGRITHWDEQSDLAVMVYTQFIHDCTQLGKRPQKDQIQEDLISARVHTSWCKPGISSYLDLKAEPTGWVVDSLKNALEAFYKKHTFEGTLRNAVERGGDADTIGAIAGGIAGAWYGYNSIPRRWIDQLDPFIKECLNELAGQAYRNRYGTDGE